MQNSMNSGNGTQEILGSLRIENATIVRNDAGRASLVMAVFNQGDTPDTLIAVSINGQPLAIPAGSYSTVSLAFSINGLTEFTSLVVPDVGYYAGYVPEG